MNKDRKMMNRAGSNEKIDEIKYFIRSSCEGCMDGNSKHLDFHKSIITHYFDARNVQIHYETKTVVAEIPVGNGYTTINFSCLELSTFLSSCLKEDEKVLEIYKDYMRIHSNSMAATEG